jgi:hypothetical protein
MLCFDFGEKVVRIILDMIYSGFKREKRRTVIKDNNNILDTSM